MVTYIQFLSYQYYFFNLETKSQMPKLDNNHFQTYNQLIQNSDFFFNELMISFPQEKKQIPSLKYLLILLLQLLTKVSVRSRQLNFQHGFVGV